MTRIKRSVKQVVEEQQVYSKPITASQTFWGATIMAFTTLGFVGYDGIRNGFSASHGAIIPVVLTGYYTVLQGRIKANDELPVYTPGWCPGPNEIDAIPDEKLSTESVDYSIAASYIPDKD